jgi:hypothetical protein
MCKYTPTRFCCAPRIEAEQRPGDAGPLAPRGRPRFDLPLPCQRPHRLTREVPTGNDAYCCDRCNDALAGLRGP